MAFEFQLYGLVIVSVPLGFTLQGPFSPNKATSLEHPGPPVIQLCEAGRQGGRAWICLRNCANKWTGNSFEKVLSPWAGWDKGALAKDFKYSQEHWIGTGIISAFKAPVCNSFVRYSYCASLPFHFIGNEFTRKESFAHNVLAEKYKCNICTH